MADPGRRGRRINPLAMLLEKADVQGYLTTDDLIEVYPQISRHP
jgi:RNA polymerase primary sigma factor